MDHAQRTTDESEPVPYWQEPDFNPGLDPEPAPYWQEPDFNPGVMPEDQSSVVGGASQAVTDAAVALFGGQYDG